MWCAPAGRNYHSMLFLVISSWSLVIMFESVVEKWDTSRWIAHTVIHINIAAHLFSSCLPTVTIMSPNESTMIYVNGRTFGDNLSRGIYPITEIFVFIFCSNTYCIPEIWISQSHSASEIFVQACWVLILLIDVQIFYDKIV